MNKKESIGELLKEIASMDKEIKGKIDDLKSLMIKKKEGKINYVV